jgi:protein-L-isoaspartate O-methyltransferase
MCKKGNKSRRDRHAHGNGRGWVVVDQKYYLIFAARCVFPFPRAYLKQLSNAGRTRMVSRAGEKDNETGELFTSAMSMHEL